RIDTGAAVFSVRKSGFNLLDQVTIGGVPLLRADGPGIELVAAGRDWTSARDASSQVLIEENGPVRAVIVARGRHLDSNGNDRLDYTVRLHFYRGHARTRVIYTLRNASERSQTNALWTRLELVVPSVLSQADFQLATSSGPVAGSLSAGGQARLFQGENSYPNFRDYDFNDFDGNGNLIRDKWPTLIEGWQASENGTPLASGARDAPIERFFGQLQSPTARLLVATRLAAGWWPQGLRLSGGGDLRIGLFPDGNDRPFRLRFTGHVTREVLLDFAPVGAAADVTYRFQHPLVARASDIEHYNRAGAFDEQLVSFAEQRLRYLATGYPTTYPDIFAPFAEIIRHYYWGTGGGRNQYDQAKVSAMNFLRWDADASAVAWQYAEQKFAYNADQAIYHSDDFDGGRGDIADFNQLPGIEAIPYAKVIFEGEHPHAYGLRQWYQLSGDERIRESYLDWGEYLFHPVMTGYDVEARGIIWRLYNLIDLWRLSGDDAYRNAAWSLFDTEMLQKTAALGVSDGTDFNRGFYASRGDTFDIYNTGLPWPDRELASFISGAMYPRSYAALEATAATPLQADRARDLLEGVSRFLITEHWWEFGPNPFDYGYPYRQSADNIPPDPRGDGNWIGGFKEVWPALYHGWRLTGEPEFQRQAERLQLAAQQDFTDEFQDWPDRQQLEHQLWYPQRHPRWVDLPVSATEVGGQYRLTWTVPANATGYWIKTSPRTIVPWLGFDRNTRNYAFNPAQFVAFFAADNLDGEPAPGPAGSSQAMDLPGLPIVASRSFAARVRIDPQLAGADVLLADGFETP
ncbi:MAG: hypothetical protein KDI48_13625, partial [Xanthomonadales bacterium]|nr:hypothetical protein [Xanthomonadales bacterium]